MFSLGMILREITQCHPEMRKHVGRLELGFTNSQPGCRPSAEETLEEVDRLYNTVYNDCYMDLSMRVILKEDLEGCMRIN